MIRQLLNIVTPCTFLPDGKRKDLTPDAACDPGRSVTSDAARDPGRSAKFIVVSVAGKCVQVFGAAQRLSSADDKSGAFGGRLE